MLYADSSEGFRPALQCIEDRTGIKANKVSEIRKEIFDHGLMTYTNSKDVLLLDWGRIASFATFDHPIFEKGQYRPIELGVKKNEHTAIRNAPGYHKPHASPDRTEEPWEQEYFDRLASMSIREYKDVFQPMTASEKEVKSQAISEEAYMKLIDVRVIDFHL